MAVVVLCSTLSTLDLSNQEASSSSTWQIEQATIKKGGLLLVFGGALQGSLDSESARRLGP